jgi:hypothetical protein
MAIFLEGFDLKTVSFTFKENNPDKKLAWFVLTQLITRITFNQQDEYGDPRNILKSLYNTFILCRDEMAKQVGAINAGVVTTKLLNFILRNFLTKWHYELEPYEKEDPISHKYVIERLPERILNDFNQSLEKIKNDLKDHKIIMDLCFLCGINTKKIEKTNKNKLKNSRDAHRA